MTHNVTEGSGKNQAGNQRFDTPCTTPWSAGPLSRPTWPRPWPPTNSDSNTNRWPTSAPGRSSASRRSSAGSTPAWVCSPCRLHHPGRRDEGHRGHRLLGPRDGQPSGGRLAAHHGSLRPTLGGGEPSLYQLPNPAAWPHPGHPGRPLVQTENVILEVTEAALASDVDGGIAKLNSLKSLVSVWPSTTSAPVSPP